MTRQELVDSVAALLLQQSEDEGIDISDIDDYCDLQDEFMADVTDAIDLTLKEKNRP